MNGPSESNTAMQQIAVPRQAPDNRKPYKRAPTKSKEEWAKIIDNYKKSNLTQREFCKQLGLSRATFSYHYHTKPKAHSRKEKILPVKILSTSQANYSTQQPFVLEIGNKKRLSIPQAYDPNALAALLTLLLGEAPC